MEYVVSNAAVARSFTSYLGSAIGFKNVDKWRFKVHGLPDGFNELDLIAVALIIALTICICYRLITILPSLLDYYAKINFGLTESDI